MQVCRLDFQACSVSTIGRREETEKKLRHQLKPKSPPSAISVNLNCCPRVTLTKRAEKFAPERHKETHTCDDSLHPEPRGEALRSWNFPPQILLYVQLLLCKGIELLMSTSQTLL